MKVIKHLKPASIHEPSEGQNWVIFIRGANVEPGRVPQMPPVSFGGKHKSIIADLESLTQRLAQ